MSENQATVISLAERRARAQAQAAEAARAQARQQARHGDGQSPAKPWLTYVLLGLNAAVWIAMLAFGVDFYEPDGAALLRWGGNLGVATVSGDWWRLLTAMFLHGGVVHLAFNLYFMWMVGRDAEHIFGPAGYALIYFGSGLLAGVVAIAWNPVSLGVGASGALFGVFGGFLAFTYRRRDALPPEYVAGVRRNALILIAISVVLGVMIPNIGLVVHIAGLIAGLGLGYAIARLAERPVTTPQQARALRVRTLGLTAGSTIVILLAGILALPRWDNPIPVLDAAEASRAEVQEAYAALGSDADARIAALEQRVLPSLRASKAELDALERVPASLAKAVEDHVRYYELEIQAYELELEGLRSGDPLVQARAAKLHAEVTKTRAE